MTAALHTFGELDLTDLQAQCKVASDDDHRVGAACLWSPALSQDMHVVIPPPTGRHWLCLRSLVRWYGEEARP